MRNVRSDVLVLFGATGDLAYKKIFPALYSMVERGTLAEPVIGVALEDWDVGKVLARARDGITKANGGIDEAVFARFASLFRYVSGDYRDQATFDKLREATQAARRPLYYLPYRRACLSPWCRVSSSPAVRQARASWSKSRSGAICRRRVG